MVDLNCDRTGSRRVTVTPIHRARPGFFGFAIELVCIQAAPMHGLRFHHTSFNSVHVRGCAPLFFTDFCESKLKSGVSAPFVNGTSCRVHHRPHPARNYIWTVVLHQIKDGDFMKTSDNPYPFPFRVLFILRIFSSSGVSHVVCTSDGGFILYRGRLPPLPARFLSENNLQGHVLQLSQTVYLISGEEVA